jgi:valyl-tRNA synthetase
MLAVEDTMVRHARMEGKTTLWVPGTEHAGISTQVVVERQLMQNAKKTRHDLGREKFLQQVWKLAMQCRSTITSQTRSMGASCDWSREQFTMSEKLSRSVRKAFRNLYEKERIYQSTYMVNWSPGAQTVVSDLEVDHREEEGKMYYLRYFIE